MTLSLRDRLFDPELCCEFDVFQAVVVLEHLADGPVSIDDLVRFKANVSLAFPPSPLAQIIPAVPKNVDPPTAPPVEGPNAIRRRYAPGHVPIVVVNFFGLFGPVGALPLPYTRRLCELDKAKGHQRTLLRDWLDLFNHRLTALLYRAWEKYRFPVGFARFARRALDDDAPTLEPDKFTQSLLSLVGLGVPSLRNRLRVVPAGPPGKRSSQPPVARVNDLALLHYAGSFARRQPSAHDLGAILTDYFQVPVRVDTFSGQWLDLPTAAQTTLGETARLGVNAVAGERVWDVGSKFRLRIGPLRYAAFEEYLPDPAPAGVRKSVFLLSQVTRFYVGPEFDFEVRLELVGEDVPDCELAEGPGFGPRLGWNTWLPSDTMPAVVDDVGFDGPCEPILSPTM
ncbi:MAG TPA: type VI secretion system baseplate subunit TssG [Fimbriiglobus sp.]